jgi:hypothetical protein
MHDLTYFFYGGLLVGLITVGIAVWIVLRK